MKSSNIGGQAVLEGIMMRHGDDYAVAVRKPDGEIFVQKEEYHSVIKWKALTKIPFIRGVFNFIDSMVLGIKTLMFSAEFYEDEEEVKSEKELTEEEIAKKEKQEKWMMNATVAISVVIAAAVFMVLPYFLSSLLKPLMPSYHLRTLVEGFVRIGIFILYIALISRMDDIQRTFMYHGAEHKCINCIEHGLPLTVDNVRISSRQHKRCGTSFLFFVMFISIVFFIFIRVDNTALQILIRILLIPVIAGVSYEVIRWAGKNDNAFVRVLSKPGMWFQKLTTREPDMDMIEVAIRAVEEVFDWRQFIAEYYSEADNPVEALVASEAELAISGSLIHGNEETRTIDIEEQKSEDNQETELTPEQKYLQMGREMEFGMDDTDRESFAFVYEASDESESTVYDNSNDYNADDKAEELTEEEVVAGFEFETGKEPEEEQYPEDVPMFKQKRLEDR